MQYQRAVSAGQINELERTEAASLLKNSQRLLQPVKVVNPYAELLELPQTVFKPRRTNAHYLHFIEAVTFLNQFQRESKVDSQTGETYIETTLEDIEAANSLLKDVLLKKSDKLSPACRSFFETLKAYLEREEQLTFKNVDIRIGLGISHSQQKRYMSSLMNDFYVKIKSGNKKSGFVYEVTSFNEYFELKDGINNVLDDTLNKLKKIQVKSLSRQSADSANSLTASDK